MANIPRPLPNILKAFIVEVEQVVANSEDRRDTIARLTPSFGALLADPTWLHADFRQPVAGKFVQYAIYRAEDSSLSVMAMVVPPGVATPVHDHRAWGLVESIKGASARRCIGVSTTGHAPILRICCKWPRIFSHLAISPRLYARRGHPHDRDDFGRRFDLDTPFGE